jgi:8-oxo-dGTP diphosphatase
VRLPLRLRLALVRAAEPKFLVGVVGIALAEDGRVLCVRHVFRPREHPWGLPSGFVRSVEGPAEAIVREIREETGYEARAEALLEARAVRTGQMELVYRLRLGPRRGGTSFEAVEAGLYRPEALPPGFLPSSLWTLQVYGFPDAAEARPGS